jgi:hypothetical protein
MHDPPDEPSPRLASWRWFAAARYSRSCVGASILAEHPLGAFKDWSRGEARLLLGPARTETATLLTGRETVDRTWLRALVLVDQLMTIAILLAAGAGLPASTPGRAALWLLVCAASYLVVVSGGHEAYSRFRVPVTPRLVVLGAAAVMAWRRPSARGRRHPQSRRGRSH